ncbi:MAG TPA: hypothetical protein VK509_09600, partial [Polyangiales bacterium]|nr:hypothetical protein [Polyangiales bacterium]
GGNTSATIAASSFRASVLDPYDLYVLSAFVTSISTLLPDFTLTTKAVVDLNAGVAAPGDVLEYRIVAHNDGSDDGVGVTLTDELPAGVTFVPGSLTILSGPNMGDKTEAAGDDQAEYDGASRTVTVRLGTGASGTAGGAIAVGESSEVRFQVTIDADTRGDVSNQGVITAAGKQGAPVVDIQTDSDATVDGRGPTTIFVEECEDDKQCKPPKGHCDVAKKPRQCVGCANSAQCDDPLVPDCDLTTGTCVCEKGPGNCVDTDMDDISDGAEDKLGTDPKDADTDDDGVIDGHEVGPAEDNDGDGTINALDPDSDNDGLPDGLELGLSCDHVGTDKAKMHCRADADRGATKTSPVDRDTDDGGATDGSEDFNLNGAIDTGETDPTTGHGADDATVVDTDDDDLGDKLEEELNSNPNDADTDEDGVIDGEEADPTIDSDLDGAINVLDVDSDNDALFDGTELGKNCMGRDTDASKMHCRPDADGGATKTSPTHADTDGGGVRDGSEDVNLDGAVNNGEKNPNKGQQADDAGTGDADMDGLSDALEDALRTGRNDADSDDDGLPDGEEANPSDDHDADGMINALDSDSDADMLFDGTELGKGCNQPATDNGRMQCRADADNGATKTSPILPDTDFGGIADGKEDRNHDGAKGPDETDPLDPSDDAECELDMDCGAADSGMICVDGACAPGCRGMNGNGCAEGQRCTSVSGEAGMCVPIVKPYFGGGGCKCGVSIADREQLPSAGLVLLSLWLATRRRKRGQV